MSLCLIPHREGEDQAHTAVAEGFRHGLPWGRAFQRTLRPETTVTGHSGSSCPPPHARIGAPGASCRLRPCQQPRGCLGPGSPPCSAKYAVSLPVAFRQWLGPDSGQILWEPCCRGWGGAGLLHACHPANASSTPILRQPQTPVLPNTLRPQHPLWQPLTTCGC